MMVFTVAPVRERGLKFNRPVVEAPKASGRSREGAWIEIIDIFRTGKYNRGRSREGAWIEIHFTIFNASSTVVAPVRERGLKSTQALREIQNELVAPVRERGLK